MVSKPLEREPLDPLCGIRMVGAGIRTGSTGPMDKQQKTPTTGMIMMERLQTLTNIFGRMIQKAPAEDGRTFLKKGHVHDV